MPTVEIDGRTITVKDGLQVIQAADRLGIEIPHYCYHPGLSIAGNCRMCLVEIDRGQKLQIACNTPVREGMVVRTTTEKVKEAQRAVLEFLLINHPIDCPVCDQAGECKLQEYYMDYGRYHSRFPLEEKVHKEKALDIGPLVVLDQERCILCARCTRFLDEVTKTGELGIFNRGDRCYIDLFPGKRVENPYSGNVVDICPVGALTSKDFRFKARVWYLQKTDSVCSFCSTGCNIEIHHRQGTIFRFRPRYHPEINRWWMCDFGRMGYKSVQGENRLLHPMLRDEDRMAVKPWDAVLRHVTGRLAQIQKTHGSSAIAGIVSARATNEEAFLFSQLVTRTIGSPHLAGVSWSPPGAYHDNFLIHADKNPNTRGLQALGISVDGHTAVKDVLRRAAAGEIKALLVLSTDVAGWFGQEALEKLDFLLVQDVLHSETLPFSDAILPQASFAETDGTFTNFAGWVQRIQPAFPPPGSAKPGWEILASLHRQLGGEGQYASAADVFAQLANTIPAFRGLSYRGLGSHGAMIAGQGPAPQRKQAAGDPEAMGSGQVGG